MLSQSGESKPCYFLRKVVDREDGAITVTAISVTTVSVTNNVASTSVNTLPGEDEVGVTRLALANTTLVVEKEAVLVASTEEEGLAVGEALASIAALGSGGGTICDSLEVGGDTRAVVGDVDGEVVLARGEEVGAEVVALGAGIVDGRTGENLSGGGGGLLSLCLEGRSVGGNAGGRGADDGCGHVGGDLGAGAPLSLGLCRSLGPVGIGLSGRVKGLPRSLGDLVVDGLCAYCGVLVIVALKRDTKV